MSRKWSGFQPAKSYRSIKFFDDNRPGWNLEKSIGRGLVVINYVETFEGFGLGRTFQAGHPDGQFALAVNQEFILPLAGVGLNF